MPSSPTTDSWRRLAGVSQSTSSIADGPGRERHAARTAGPRGRRGCAGRSRPRRGRAARRRSSDRMSTSCVARSTVTPTSRMRAGNGPARRLVIAKTVDSQPASSSRPSSRTAGLNRSMWPTWTGGAPARRRGGHDLVRLGRRRRQRLLDEDGDPALDRGEGERQVGRRRRGDDDGVEVGLGEHRQRLGEALGAGRAAAAAERVGVRVGDGHEPDVRRPGPGRAGGCGPSSPRPIEPDAQLAVADRRPGAGHRAAAPWRVGRRWRPSTAARTAAMTVVLLRVGQAREHRQRQRPLGRARR